MESDLGMGSPGVVDLGSQIMLPARAGPTPRCMPSPTHATTGRSCAQAPPRQPSVDCPPVEALLVDEVGPGEDEDFAHDVRVLLVAAHQADHVPAGRSFDHGVEALTNEVLEVHPLLDHG